MWNAQIVAHASKGNVPKQSSTNEKPFMEIVKMLKKNISKDTPNKNGE